MIQKGKPLKDNRYNVTIDFTKQIEFNINIHKIQEVATENGNRVWIDGTSVMNGRRKHLFFYCPSELEYMLRQERIEVGNMLHIQYIGENIVYGSRVKEFYIKKLDNKPKNFSTLEHLDKLKDDYAKDPEKYEQAFRDSD